MHAEQSQGSGRMSGDAGTCRVRGDTLMTPDQFAVQCSAQLRVGSSRNWSVFLERP